jgi:uncharacterized protein (DUF2062 family)
MALKIFDKLKNKILIPFKLVPKAGLSAEKLAFSVTIGIIAGLFPVIGTTTLLSLLLTLLFRQNLLIVQSVQWLMALFQLLLIIPFMRLGTWLMNNPELQINIDHIKLAFEPGILEGIKTIGTMHLYGILGWIVIAIPVGAVSYVTFLYVFRNEVQK